MEIWKNIDNFNNYYQVSNLGNIKSVNRLSLEGRNYKGKKLKLSISKNGYLYVGLSKNGKTKMFPVHRIVIETFLGYSNLVCDHIDNDKTNNCLTNLRYISHRENMSKFHQLKNILPTGVQKTINGKFVVYIRAENNKKICLGTFCSVDEAKNAYLFKLKTLE